MISAVPAVVLMHSNPSCELLNNLPENVPGLNPCELTGRFELENGQILEEVHTSIYSNGINGVFHCFGATSYDDQNMSNITMSDAQVDGTAVIVTITAVVVQLLI